jgi:hypothetical protein
MSDLKTQSQGGTQTLEQGSLLDEILNEGKIKPSEEGYDVVRRGVQHFIAEMLAPGRAGRARRQEHRRRDDRGDRLAAVRADQRHPAPP